MLSDIPGLSTALLILAAFIFAWCFIFTATYAAFRIAQRPRPQRIRKQKKRDAPLRFPAEWSSRTHNEPQQRYSFESANHDRYGDLSIKPAPGPRDWEPRS